MRIPFIHGALVSRLVETFVEQLRSKTFDFFYCYRRCTTLFFSERKMRTALEETTLQNVGLTLIGLSFNKRINTNFKWQKKICQ